MNNLMIDLETLGTGKNSVILSIGAVLFEPGTGKLGEEFYSTITRSSCEALGLVADVNTLLWWEKQPEEARTVLKCPHAEDISVVLKRFFDWLVMHTPSCDKLQVWGNGPSFDCALLSNAYDKANILLPWRYWNERCVRTMDALGLQLLNINPKKTIPRSSVKHHALEDAKHQALYVSSTYQALLKSVGEKPSEVVG